MAALNDPLDQVLTTARPRPFALLHRPAATGPDTLDVLVGRISLPRTLAELPPHPADGPAPHEVLAVVPYRQLTERGFACVDDGAPLIALRITGRRTVPVGEALARLPRVPTPLTGGDFDSDDADYARTVRRVVDEAIGAGEGSNFVLRRTFTARIGDYGPHSALAVFRRLLERESGAYWTFLIHTGTRTFVGASPERHLTLAGGTAVMNPISGTYRYPAAGATLPGVLDFLGDRKETDELNMVVDEELKMMARICPAGGRVVGPFLKEMARLAHTEYLIEGRTGRDPRDLLRETMFAATVTGSPLQNAARVIARHERGGRGYYGGVAALLGRDAAGAPALDSAILIRTAEIDPAGRLSLGVGASLVRHSDPAAEVAETRAKAAGLLTALESGHTTRSLADHPDVRTALARRNRNLARYWLGEDGRRDGGGGDGGRQARSASGAAPPPRAPGLHGRTVLVLDAEDTFTAMTTRQLRSLGLDVTVRRWDEPHRLHAHDLVLLGPGPGDPGERGQPRIDRLHTAVDTLLARRRPFLAVCLSHQVLALRLGFPLARRAVPHQGEQREIDHFGRRERVGFYNTFAAHSHTDRAEIDGVGAVDICRDPATGEVHALRGPRFVSMQFHAESVLTQNGPALVAHALRHILGTPREGA
ncbi:anthranilate synthase family protein [Streptomyces sp. NPDC091377]|uniref:anthranilate synthase family protein n=1 Tax=Streptomyces sp. NPDC091377 TaxID=3365995 RepID=UPI0037F55417